MIFLIGRQVVMTNRLVMKSSYVHGVSCLLLNCLYACLWAETYVDFPIWNCSVKLFSLLTSNVPRDLRCLFLALLSCLHMTLLWIKQGPLHLGVKLVPLMKYFYYSKFIMMYSP